MDVIDNMNYSFEDVETICTDGGYRGELSEVVKQKYDWSLQIVMRSNDVKQFTVLSKR